MALPERCLTAVRGKNGEQHMKSILESLPPDFDPSLGIRNLRLRDTNPISTKSMTTLDYMDFTSADLHAGHVYATNIRLRLWGSGNWWFTARLSDTSVVFGDNYAIGFSFADGNRAGGKAGELGADLTRQHQHITVAIEGRSEYLQRNYLQVAAGGVKFSLHQSDDLGQVFSNLLDDLKWLGSQLKVMVYYDSDSTGPDAPSEPTGSYPPGDTDGDSG